MSFQTAAAILTALASEATGQAAQAVRDISDYISVGQVTLRTGYDPLNTALSQMVSKTIFAHRPWTG